MGIVSNRFERVSDKLGGDGMEVPTPEDTDQLTRPVSSGGECGSSHVFIPRIRRICPLEKPPPADGSFASLLRVLDGQRRQAPGAHARSRPPACFRDDVVCRRLRQSERKSGSGRFPWDLPACNCSGGRYCAAGATSNSRLKATRREDRSQGEIN
jgi:hypothetical protein